MTQAMVALLPPEHEANWDLVELTWLQPDTRHLNGRVATGALNGLGQPVRLVTHHLFWRQEDVLVQKTSEEKASLT